MSTPLNDFMSFDLSVLCEDVREEVGKKLSLMGVFTSEIYVAEFPATMRLAFLVVVTSQRTGDFEIGMRLLVDEEKVADVVSKIHFSDEARTSNLVIPVGFLRIDKAGTISLQVRYGEGEWREALSRSVSIGPTK